jgi:hypothetical protein
MAFYISSNNQPATHAASIWSFFSFITDSSGANWTCVASGDGKAVGGSYSATSGAAITSATSLNNQNAWFVIKSPDSATQFLFQRLAASSDWKVTYSKSNFVYTSAGAATAPTLATNANNGASEGSVVFNGTLFPNSENTYVFNICAGDRSNEYCSFYFFAYKAGELNKGATTMFVFDVIEAAGKADGDLDPYVVYVNANSNPKDVSDGVLFNERMHKSADSTGRNTFKGFVCYNMASPSQSFVNMTVSSYGSAGSSSRSSSNYAPYNVAPNAYVSATDETLPVYYFHVNSTQGIYDSFKGGSHLMLYGNPLRATGETLTLSATSDKIFVNGFLFPWTANNSLRS